MNPNEYAQQIRETIRTTITLDRIKESPTDWNRIELVRDQTYAHIRDAIKANWQGYTAPEILNLMMLNRKHRAYPLHLLVFGKEAEGI
jgi:hypothetical protein